jgi:hypothetical protein
VITQPSRKSETQGHAQALIATGSHEHSLQEISTPFLRLTFSDLTTSPRPYLLKIPHHFPLPLRARPSTHEILEDETHPNHSTRKKQSRSFLIQWQNIMGEKAAIQDTDMTDAQG